MSYLSVDVKKIFDDLNNAYHLLAQKHRDSLPDALKNAFEQYSQTTTPTSLEAWTISNIFLNNLNIFQRYRLPSQFNFYRSALYSSLQIINKAGLLSGQFALSNFEQFIKHPERGTIAKAVYWLNRAALLDSDNRQCHFTMVVEHQSPDDLVKLLTVLNSRGLLHSNRVYFAIAAMHQKPWILAEALNLLHKRKLLNAGHFIFIAKHQAPWNSAAILDVLSEEKLLAGKNGAANIFAVLTDNPFCQINHHAIRILKNSNLLNQCRFNDLLTYSPILFGPQSRNIWDRIPYQHLTIELYDQIIALAKRYTAQISEGERAFLDLMNNTLLKYQIINPAQSTHLPSVDHSIAKSAKNLWERYRNELENEGLTKKLDALCQWAANLPDNSLKERAAKTCLKNLMKNTHSYVDPFSQVSTKQLLALFWIAIHDQDRISGALADMKNRLVEALYEIQRGYNLSDNSIDNNNLDMSICASGGFNKLVEQLSGHHPDVQVIFISNETACAKFKIVVNEELVLYLKSLGKLECRAPNTLADVIKDGCVEKLWHKISTQVSERIFDEFSSLYNEDRECEHFRGLIDSGQYVRLSKESIAVLNTRIVYLVVNEELVLYLKSLGKLECRELDTLADVIKDGCVEKLWHKISTQVSKRIFDEFSSLYNEDRECEHFRGLIDSGQYVRLSKESIAALNTRIADPILADKNRFFLKAPDEQTVKDKEASSLCTMYH